MARNGLVMLLAVGARQHCTMALNPDSRQNVGGECLFDWWLARRCCRAASEG
ncbi:hypothetical protein IFT67_04455 [Sphingomonas sp. CFBP 13728]|uniref:hypothetical protein n=1 Tax=Sphingomonas sp. CFBP 13728 TaxID=2775294 RepID=UPI0017826A93|nr:hypothetical protein [Sphingomonas sp. CFBP 13728]MBD8618166.1 hypothetical protein [Sphingomonas sp. CFBP 13728]